ncbi:MAG: ATPase [Acidobacteriaceae bacterium]|nr:ATPase [Acidobacteriaceae bacterium]
MEITDLNTVPAPLTFLCLASFEKGHRTLEELKRQGCRVFLLTSLSLRDKAKWPRESLEDIFYLPDQEHQWDAQDMIRGVSHLCRTQQIDRILPLDDFDVERAALLREHLRLPGLGETASRYFRDKLAMRMRAAESGIRVPEFTATFNYERITNFLEQVPGPWVLKPRLMAGAIGIKKVHHAQEVWDRVHAAGDEQSFFVLERFVPGSIFHVDSIWSAGEMVYAIASAYGTPPLKVTTGGGIFTTRILPYGSEEDLALRAMNERVLKAFQLLDGVSHTEFIRAEGDGSYYFLETSARVGGAHISDLIEAATGMNFWEEWAKVEIAAATGRRYTTPQTRKDYGGLLVSLARQEWPDTSSFQEPELVWRMKKKHHIGFIVKSPRWERVEELINVYAQRVRDEYHASAPPLDRLRE